MRRRRAFLPPERASVGGEKQNRPAGSPPGGRGFGSRAFARSGYDGASIRTIVAAADVNQAAINYHFGSKDGLYRAVLQAALLALMQDGDAEPNTAALPRELALRRFVRQQLRPMTSGDELSSYVRIFSWETLKPSPVFHKFMAREAAPFFAAATDLVRRFLPSGATDKQAVVGAGRATAGLGRCRLGSAHGREVAGRSESTSPEELAP